MSDAPPPLWFRLGYGLAVGAPTALVVLLTCLALAWRYTSPSWLLPAALGAAVRWSSMPPSVRW